MSEPHGFESMDHATIMSHVQVMDPARVDAVVAAWRVIAERLEESAAQFSDAVRAASDGWEGQSAGAAAPSMARCLDTAEQLQVSTVLTANKIEEMNTGLRQVEALMPDVPDTGGFWSAGTGAMVEAQGFGTAMGHAHAKIAEAEAEARRIMTAVYTPVVAQADDQVPVLPGPPAPPSAISGPGASGGTGGFGGGPGGFGGGGAGGGSVPFAGTPTATPTSLRTAIGLEAAPSAGDPSYAPAAQQTSPGMGDAVRAAAAAPGARGGGDDDKEHKTPGYLVNVDNGNELIVALDAAGVDRLPYPFRYRAEPADHAAAPRVVGPRVPVSKNWRRR
ncbi:WXG100 family type VII secretion target [Rhodococcus rhodnii]|uniref:WXG100 family type VII secretion target n=1 Tax=Rhodococcus rhodnii TaxID=38312 RepID=UPI0011604E76|nr:hypothetical protein [Rhodococcus rhodnii]